MRLKFEVKDHFPETAKAFENYENGVIITTRSKKVKVNKAENTL
jgi:hypothetical protein